MKIYSTKDRIKIAIDDIVVSIAPLTYAQKKEVQTMLIQGQKDGKEELFMDASFKAVQYAVKEIDGLETPDGSKYNLETKGPFLTDDCVSDLLNIETSSRLSAICLALVNGIPTKIMNPITNEPMEGVKIINPQRKRKR